MRFVVLIDKFLDYVDSNLARDAYIWYQSRLQRWTDKYPHLTLATLKKHHARTWIGKIEGSPGTKRNYARAIQWCLSWCKEEDVIERFPPTLPRSHLFHSRDDHKRDVRSRSVCGVWAWANDCFWKCRGF